MQTALLITLFYACGRKHWPVPKMQICMWSSGWLSTKHDKRVAPSFRHRRNVLVSELSNTESTVLYSIARRREVQLFNSMAYPGRDVRHGSDWLTYWDVLETVAWIARNCFKRVTLQFPDELLAESTLVAAAIQHECATRKISTQVSGQLSGSNDIRNGKQC